jgi:DNA end-binding protein Ku
MRAIWKGSISFSLVNIPISLYAATRHEELKFHLLRKTDMSPIRYRRVAEQDEKEVPWEEIVKGYEYEKGQFVMVTDEDFKRADVQATQNVEILEFVPLKDIDPMFFDKPYYLEPQKRGEKAYALLRESLRQTGKVGIAKVVIKTRQHLAALKPAQNALVLELMHFAEELVKPDTLQIPGQVELGSKELDMAAELIGRMTDKWKPEKYTDDYRHRVLELIQKKVEAGGVTPPGESVAPKTPSKVIDLVSILQESLQQKGGHKPGHTSPAKSGAIRKQARHRKSLKKAA